MRILQSFDRGEQKHISTTSEALDIHTFHRRRQQKSPKWQHNEICSGISSGQLQSVKYNHSLFIHIVPLFLKFYTIQSVQKVFKQRGGLLRGKFVMLSGIF